MAYHDMRRPLRNVVVRAVAIALLFDEALVFPAAAQSQEEPPVYELGLVYVFETPEPEFLFVIGNSGFRTVSSLKAFLASRPEGTTLRWSPGCVRLGAEPLLSSESEMEEFQAFCFEHHINFVLVPSG
jgi:hypothetical protein